MDEREIKILILKKAAEKYKQDCVGPVDLNSIFNEYHLDKNEVEFCIQYLIDREYLIYSAYNYPLPLVTITPKGYDFIKPDPVFRDSQKNINDKSQHIVVGGDIVNSQIVSGEIHITTQNQSPEIKEFLYKLEKLLDQHISSPIEKKSLFKKISDLANKSVDAIKILKLVLSVLGVL